MKIAILVLFVLIFLICGCEEIAKELSTTVSGFVRDDGAGVSGALVFLLEFGDTASAGMNLSNGSVTSGAGNYTIVEVDPGDYYLCAIKDVNENLSFDPDTDAVGYYGEVDTLLGISIPAKLTVAENEDLANIDVDEMYSIVPDTGSVGR